jgi:Na+/proline symporter
MVQTLGVVVFFAIVRNLLEGFGGYSGGYGPQRFYAARDERSASLMTAEWVGLLSIRWALVISLAILGLWIAQTDTLLGAELYADPEKTLPVVLGTVLPAGLKGLAVAGLIAAAMSTFDSTVNAGAAYWVRDIYQRYLRRGATERQLVRQSWLSSLTIAAVAVLLAMAIHNINEIWTWITGPLSAGLFGPLILRWYWGRFNGWGFAASTGAGLVMSILLKLVRPDMQLEWSFTATLAVSVVAGVVGSLATAPVPAEVADKYFAEMRPFGLWAGERRRADPELATRAAREGLRDFGNLPFAIGWQLGLFLCVVYFVMHSWDRSLAFLAASTLCAVVLYFTWYKKLPAHE